MKFHGVTVLIPFFDTTGMKHWVNISTNDTIDRRRIWRGVRKYVQDAFKTTVNNDWVKAHCRIIPMIRAGKPKEYQDFTQKYMDDLYMRIQQDETQEIERLAHTEGTEDSAQAAGEQVPDMHQATT